MLHNIFQLPIQYTLEDSPCRDNSAKPYHKWILESPGIDGIPVEVRKCDENGIGENEKLVENWFSV